MQIPIKRGIIYLYADLAHFGMPNTVIRQLFTELGVVMAKKKSITRISNKKRGRPKVRFSIWGLIMIFGLSFAACFILYMLAANFNDNFFNEEFDKVVVEEQDKGSQPQNDDASGEDTDSPALPDGLSVTNPIPQSESVDPSYLDKCVLITDSTLIDMAKYTGLKDVIGSNELGASSCNTVNIESSYGTKTAYEILQVKKPEKVYIMLGSDKGSVSVDDMIAGYTKLVKNLRGYLTESDIYIMQLPPVKEETETVSNGAINEFNTKLLSLANTTNVFCIDTNTALKGNDGLLADGFAGKENGALTEKCYKTIEKYILCHTV